MLKSFFTEFKKFALRGNAVDMAVGIIIGASFGKIVDSLVKDILLPPMGVVLGKIDFSNLFFVLQRGREKVNYASVAEANADGAVTLNLGLFINSLISFVIVALAVFMLIKTLNKLQEKIDISSKDLKTKECPYCCSLISSQAKRCPYCTSELERE